MDELSRLIGICLASDATTREPPPPEIGELTKFGDVAYDAVKARLASGELTASEIAAALRCLAHLSQHHGFERQVDILGTALSDAGDPHREVRTAAAHQLVWGTRLIKARFKAPPDPTKAPSQVSIRKAVREALALGVDPRFRRTFEEFVDHG